MVVLVIHMRYVYMSTRKHVLKSDICRKMIFVNLSITHLHDVYTTLCHESIWYDVSKTGLIIQLAPCEQELIDIHF